MIRTARSSIAAAALACVQAASANAAAPLPPAVDQQLARDMLKGLVEINTTHAHGSTEAAKAIQSWLLSAGFLPADVVLIAPARSPHEGQASWCAIAAGIRLIRCFSWGISTSWRPRPTTGRSIRSN